MNNRIRTFLSVFIILISLAMFSVTASAEDTNGVYINSSKVYSGDEFDVKIRIPAVNKSADTVSIKVEFDSSAFELVEWSPVVQGGVVGSGENFFSLSAANAQPVIDLSSGLTFTAKMKVKDGAIKANYEFTLKKNSVSYVAADGRSFVELWAPTNISAGIEVGERNTTGEKPALSVSSTDLKAGDRFNVSINIPSINKNADTATLRVEFDSDAFDVAQWAPVIPGGTSGSGKDFFSLSAANAEKKIDLSNGITLTAALVVKNGARAGNYNINLVKNSLSYVDDSGRNNIELWSPTMTKATVRVIASSVTTTSTTTNSPIVTTRRDDDTPWVTTKTTKKTTTKKNDKNPVIIDEETDDDDKDGKEENRKNKLTLSNVLKGLSAEKAKMFTKNKFFKNDTRVILKSTGYADECAEVALKNLGLSDHPFYAFDISVFDEFEEKNIEKLEDGYIEFHIPVPKALMNDTDALSVYHIKGGYPEEIASVVEESDGEKIIVFSADSFSPYMFVDTVNVKKAEAVAEEQTVTKEEENPPQNNVVNPATGPVFLLIIPLALFGCILLIRKQKRRYIHRGK